jgi:hypothetical protein
VDIDAPSNEETYDVYWEAAGPLGAVDKSILAKSHVLYFLVGFHAVYGNRSLLYIGKSERDGVGSRLTEHLKFWGAAEASDLETYVATADTFTTWEAWRANSKMRYETCPPSSTVAMLEALLIYVHQPAYNAKGLARPPSGTHIRIFNTGKYAPLLPEISTRRWADVRRPSLQEGDLR